jgi:hypothetical protein
MRLIFNLIVILTFNSCSNFNAHYNKHFYEKVSHIIIPPEAKVIESIDNAEFVTTTVFDGNQVDLTQFIATYHFTKIESPFHNNLLGNPYLQSNHVDYTKVDDFYFIEGSAGKTSWVYLVDMNSKKIWAEIRYPDMTGI